MQHVADHGYSYGTIEEFNFRANIFAERNEEIEMITTTSLRSRTSIRIWEVPSTPCTSAMSPPRTTTTMARAALLAKNKRRRRKKQQNYGM